MEVGGPRAGSHEIVRTGAPAKVETRAPFTSVAVRSKTADEACSERGAPPEEAVTATPMSAATLPGSNTTFAWPSVLAAVPPAVGVTSDPGSVGATTAVTGVGGVTAGAGTTTAGGAATTGGTPAAGGEGAAGAAGTTGGGTTTAFGSTTGCAGSAGGTYSAVVNVAGAVYTGALRMMKSPALFHSCVTVGSVCGSVVVAGS